MPSVVVEKNDLVFRIQLNRPEKKNAFDPEMIEALTQAFLSTKNSSARLVLLEGAGSSFSAGADLEWMKSMKGYAFDKNQKDSVQLFAMFEAAAQCPIPIVAKVKGHVMGGANGLVAMADIAAACSDTVFAFSEVRLGLVPAVISPFVLAKMNKASAREKMITGRRFSAQEALDSGLVQFVGAEKAVDRFINEITEAILNSGPEAVHTTIQLLGDLDRCSDWEQIKELTTRVIAERRVSVEGQEGLTAFFDKRKPTWSKSLNANH